MVQLKLFLFGPPRLERAGRAVQINQRKMMALLVYLAVSRQAHSRDALATLLWPDKDQRAGRANLRRILHPLHQILGQNILLATPELVSFQPQAELWLDIELYQQHLAACLPGPDAGGELSPECLARLAEAAALYSADLLAGFNLPDCPDFDEWQFFQAESLRQSLAQVLEQLILAYQARAEFETALPYARRWLALDPLHEPAQRRLMQLYDQAGQPAAALRQYLECARLFEAEFGLPPSEETTTLYEAIKAKHLLSPFIKEVEAQALRERGPRQKAPPDKKAGAGDEALASPPPETRYVESGGVHIAYQLLGQGPVDLVFVGGFVSHLEHIWEEPDLARFLQRLASMARLILFDKRGIGLSDRVGDPPTLEHTMDDILAVMDAAGSKRAVVLGVSQGGANSALFAAIYPERVLGLIIYGALSKWMRGPDYPWGVTHEQFNASLRPYITGWGGPVRLEYFAPSRAADEDFRRWWAKLLRLASSPGGVRSVLEASRDIDIRHVLPTIQAPTLVLHRAGDKVIRLEAGRYMAQLIPGAQFVTLPGNDHFWWVGDSEAVLAEIERFIRTLKQPSPTDRVLATILCAESSEIDREAASYQALVREEIARFRGREVRRSGQPLVATFDGSSRALRCAIAIQALARLQGVASRVGLHTGECELIEGEFGGPAVELAAEIMNKARPGQVLVSGTVRDLVMGAGFTFVEHGRYTFNAVPGEWPLFALES